MDQTGQCIDRRTAAVTRHQIVSAFTIKDIMAMRPDQHIVSCRTVFNRIAVSYTHLDVYKRQEDYKVTLKKTACHYMNGAHEMLVIGRKDVDTSPVLH